MTSGAGLLLLAVVGGYWVLERANTHEGSLRRIGLVIGALVIVVAIVGTACKIAGAMACGPSYNKAGHFWSCPINIQK